MDLLKRVWIDDSGQDTSEYALLLVLVAAVLLAAITTLRESIATAFTRVSEVLTNAPV